MERLKFDRRINGVIDEITERKLLLLADKKRTSVSAEIRKAIEKHVRNIKLPTEEPERAAS